MQRFLRSSTCIFLSVILFVLQTNVLEAKNSIGAVFPSSETSDFEIDEIELDLLFQELNELDEYIVQNEGMTYEDVRKVNNELILNVNNESGVLSMADDGPVLGIPSFLWGCVLGLAGLIIVYIVTDNNREEVKKAFTGCLVSVAVTGLIYLVAAAAYY